MPYVEFQRWILAAILAMARIGGAFAICPALTDSMIPGTARRAFVLACACIVIPYVMTEMPPGEPNVWMFSVAVAKEALIGFLLGFFGAIPFWIAENVGNFIDNQRGATMGEVFSPLSGAQVSSTGLFFTQIVSTLFFIGGAIFVFLTAIYSSYAFFPVFQGFTFQPGAPIQILNTLDGMLQTTVVISAPIVFVMFLTTIGLGFVNRTAPQLNVFFLSMPIKSAMGIAMLVVYLPYIMDKLMYTNADFLLKPLRTLISATPF